MLLSFYAQHHLRRSSPTHSGSRNLHQHLD
jgi:hypothetical protein